MFEHRAVIVGTTPPTSVRGEIIELSFSYFLLFKEIVVIDPASSLACDCIRYISFFFRIEVVAMALVLIDTLEILQNLFGKGNISHLRPFRVYPQCNIQEGMALGI